MVGRQWLISLRREPGRRAMVDGRSLALLAVDGRSLALLAVDGRLLALLAVDGRLLRCRLNERMESAVGLPT